MRPGPMMATLRRSTAAVMLTPPLLDDWFVGARTAGGYSFTEPIVRPAMK